MFKWDTDMTDKEFIEMMNEVNKKGCATHINGYEPMCPNYEPMYEEEHINKAVLQYSPVGMWQDVFSILLQNGYEVTARVDGGEVVITWKDKNDLVEEIKREARKIEAER